MTKKRILVVDDEKEFAQMLKIRLEAIGCEVLMAFDGSDGLEKAREEKPDLIILDVMMPKIDGYQMCRMLKFDDNYKNIPVIMVTARGQEADKKTGKEVGADEYITKPLDNKELITLLNKYLGAF